MAMQPKDRHNPSSSNMSSSLPVRGNFNGLNLPEWDREMIESGFQAVS